MFRFSTFFLIFYILTMYTEVLSSKAEPESCIPGEIYKKDCNNCQCLSDKSLVCSTMMCLSQNLTDKVQEIFKKRSKQRKKNTKETILSQNSKALRASDPLEILKSISPEKLSTLPSLRDGGSRCSPGKKYRVQCNACICLQNGDLSCTKLLCLDYNFYNDEGARKLSGKPCPLRSNINSFECITCKCKNNTIDCKGIPECIPKTRRAVDGKNAIPKNSIDLKKEKCEKGNQYMVDCNKCVCLDPNNLRCTVKTCLTYSDQMFYKNLLKKMKNDEETEEDNDSDKTDSHEDPKKEYGKHWVLFGDENNILHYVDMTIRFVNKVHNKIDVRTDDKFVKIRLFLYTRKNPKFYEEITIRNNELRSKFFVDRHPMKVLLHGWKHSGNSSIVTDFKDAYLKMKNVNVIIVDWADAANLNYVVAASYSEDIGNMVGKQIQMLMHKFQVNPNKVHIIGQSLGAQIAGFAGRWLANHNWKISRVTGLDPARPLFEVIFNRGIEATDASFVDIIHTNKGILGLEHNHGVADFYPNGGGPLQPGCNEDERQHDFCSHRRAFELFLDSILNGGFISHKCDSWWSYKQGRCNKNDAVKMGEHCPHTTRGTYYLRTKSKSPYALV